MAKKLTAKDKKILIDIGYAAGVTALTNLGLDAITRAQATNIRRILVIGINTALVKAFPGEYNG